MTEYVIILIPNIMYILAKKLSIKNYFRLNKIGLKQVIYTIGIIIFSYPLAVVLNAIALGIISIFTDFMPESVPLASDFKTYILSLIVIGVSPGICEEIMFRGTIIRGYEKLGKKKAIIISAILFGVFHFNIQNLIGPIFLGLILGSLVYKSNSIIPSIIGHALNNSIAMTLGYMINNPKFYDRLMLIENTISPKHLIIIISISIIGIKYLMNKFPKEEISMETQETGEKTNIWEYIPLLMILILYIWVNGVVYFNLF